MWIYFHYIELFIYNIKNNINFSFAHFNDGELSLIIRGSSVPVISRGKQDYSEQLRLQLLQSLNYDKKNYYPGIPCSKCHRSQYEYCKNILNWEKDIPACVFHHTKITHFDKFISCLKDKKIYWIVNNNKNLHNLKKYSLDITTKIVIPSKNAFSVYETIKNKLSEFEENSIVILLCGPLGRILAQEWFEKNDNITYLCLGSYFDSILENKTYGYDNLYNHGDCSECFPKNVLRKY